MVMFMMIELLMSAYAIYQLQSRCIKMLHFVEQLITLNNSIICHFGRGIVRVIYEEIQGFSWQSLILFTSFFSIHRNI